MGFNLSRLTDARRYSSEATITIRAGALFLIKLITEIPLTALAVSRFLQAIIILAPRLAKSRAVSLPMPLLAPFIILSRANARRPIVDTKWKAE
uniref:Uncharacterized protein n=1 Tax=Glossina palpalis gambiensis TaxID=67801 RepID=A0A1B0BJC0_9MUSC